MGMVLTLEIHKAGPGEYLATLSVGGQAVTDDLGPYNSLTHAIQGAAKEIPGAFAQFVEPRYAGVSAGTMSVVEASNAATAAACADRIIRVVAALNDSEDR